MSAFAPKETTPNSGNHPGDEELAAYIDGMLGPEKASRVTEHLAACADCYHIYSEVVAFQLESQVEPPAENVVPFPEKKEEKASDPPPRRSLPSVRWIAAAALVVVGLGIGWFVFQTLLVERPELTTAELVPSIPNQRSVEEIVWKHYRPRGGEGGEEEIQRQSFQVGALLVDFRLSVQVGDVERGADAWQHVGIVVQNALSMEDEGKRILDEANQIKSLKDLRRIASSAPAREAALGGSNSILFPEYLDFGKWTEAGRVSAILRNSTFLQREENRQFLSYLLSGKDEDMVLEPEVREPLQKIERIWDGGPLDGKDFQALAKSFQGILNQYDFRPSVDDPF
jgi:hypothetical protein